jgi:hypothetical protein
MELNATQDVPNLMNCESESFQYLWQKPPHWLTQQLLGTAQNP